MRRSVLRLGRLLSGNGVKCASKIRNGSSGSGNYKAIVQVNQGIVGGLNFQRMFHDTTKDYFAQRRAEISQQLNQQQQQHQYYQPPPQQQFYQQPQAQPYYQQPQQFYQQPQTSNNSSVSQDDVRQGLRLANSIASTLETVKFRLTPSRLQNAIGTTYAVLSILFLSLIIYYFVIRPLFGGGGKSSGGMGDFIGITSEVKKAQSNVTFNDVRGIDEVKHEVSEIVDYLRRPAEYEAIGAKIPKGILLAGPPGTGKTLLARAMAGEAGVPFFYTSASEFDEVFVGVGAARIRKLFEEAAKNAPAIVFIDELDSIGNRQNTMMSHSGTINQLLSILDGFERGSKVLVMAATNFTDRIDPALIRPGRFDKVVQVPLPDMKGRQEIAQYYISKVKSESDVSAQDIAAGTPGFSGADIENLVNRAAIKAAGKGLKKMNTFCLEEAKDDITMGVARPSLMLTEKEKRLVAYHESGHTLVAYFTKGVSKLHKVTILPRGSSLGSTHGVMKRDETVQSKSQLMAELAKMMGGKAAEELVFGKEEITTGPAGDLQQATKLATNFIAHCGMSDTIGNVSLQLESDMMSGAKISEEGRRLVETEVKNVLDERYKFAKELLTKHRKELDALAQALMDHETLNREEIEAVVQGKSLESAKWARKSNVAKPSAPITKIPVGEDIGKVQM